MTNEELKKKIVEVVLNSEITGIQIRAITGGYSMANNIADALIAAGIGDVSELKNHRVVAEYSLIPEDGNSYVLPNRPLRITQLYSGEEVEKIVKERKEFKDELRSKVEYIHEQDEVIKEYKHRAARAERAFSKLAHEMYEHGIRPMCDEKFFTESRLKEAEKELAEEMNKEIEDLQKSGLVSQPRNQEVEGEMI